MITNNVSTPSQSQALLVVDGGMLLGTLDSFYTSLPPPHSANTPSNRHKAGLARVDLIYHLPEPSRRFWIWRSGSTLSMFAYGARLPALTSPTQLPAPLDHQ